MGAGMNLMEQIGNELLQKVAPVSFDRCLSGKSGVVTVEGVDGRHYDAIYKVRHGNECLKRGSVRVVGK